MGDIDRMLDNVEADSWSDLNDSDDYVFDDDRADPLDRLTSYVDYCFDTYDVVAHNLDRDQIQTCIADWDRRRGQCKYHARMKRQRFGKQVRSQHRERVDGHYAVFVAEPLIGVLPEDDKGVGWKPCVRHELGHAIDFEQRDTSDHSRKFKHVMAQFGEDTNNGQHEHGWAPSVHR